MHESLAIADSRLEFVLICNDCKKWMCFKVSILYMHVLLSQQHVYNFNIFHYKTAKLGKQSHLRIKNLILFDVFCLLSNILLSIFVKWCRKRINKKIEFNVDKLELWWIVQLNLIINYIGYVVRVRVTRIINKIVTKLLDPIWFVLNLHFQKQKFISLESYILIQKKRSVLRRQSGDTNRNTKRSVYCQYG